MSHVSQKRPICAGFSLVEMLIVLTIVLVLGAMSALSLPGLMSAQTVAQASSDISQLLDDARTYALANHTYVFVGFEEVSAANLPNAAGQTLVSPTAGGRVAILVVSAKDGSSNISSSSPYFNASNLVPISKVRFISSVHLADLTNLSAPAGPLAARALVSPANSLGANSSVGGTALFTWPLNVPASSAQYSFYPGQVIMFDQEGLAGVVNSSTYTAAGYTAPTSSWIEIGLQLAHGSAVPSAPNSLTTGQLASIQLDGITGANRVLLP